jgi:hypothetical protein
MGLLTYVSIDEGRIESILVSMRGAKTIALGSNRRISLPCLLMDAILALDHSSDTSVLRVKSDTADFKWDAVAFVQITISSVFLP